MRADNEDGGKMLPPDVIHQGSSEGTPRDNAGINEGGDHASTGGVANDSKDKAPSKFAALYHKEKEVKAGEAALQVKKEEADGNTAFDWKTASWADKNAKLDELGIDYEEWTDHLAGSNETEAEKEWREMKEWKEGEQDRLTEQEKGIKIRENEQQEVQYIKSLTDLVAADTEKYELVSLHPQKEELLLLHARDYAKKYGEVPNSEELISFTEEQILIDGKHFIKSKKLRDLIMSEGRSEEIPLRSEESNTTLSNQLERQLPAVEVRTALESREERIGRLSNKFGI